MQSFLRAALVGLGIALLQSCVAADADRGRRDGDRWGACGREHRIELVNLDMSPDPIREGERVREWKVTMRVKGRSRCETKLEIRERPGDDLAGRERVGRLRPGINEVEFEPIERYRFSRREHCFQVIANIEGTGRAVDASRRFCARQLSGRRWTLRD